MSLRAIALWFACAALARAAPARLQAPAQPVRPAAAPLRGVAAHAVPVTGLAPPRPAAEQSTQVGPHTAPAVLAANSSVPLWHLTKADNVSVAQHIPQLSNETRLLTAEVNKLEEQLEAARLTHKRLTRQVTQAELRAESEAAQRRNLHNSLTEAQRRNAAAEALARRRTAQLGAAACFAAALCLWRICLLPYAAPQAASAELGGGHTEARLHARRPPEIEDRSTSKAPRLPEYFSIAEAAEEPDSEEVPSSSRTSQVTETPWWT